MNQEMLDRVMKSPRLPSLPTIALEVIDLVQHRDVNIKQIANTIQHDPALSSKILKTVNSSFYGQAYSVSSISHALVVLGLNSVKTLALGFSLVGNLQDSGGMGFDHFAYWKRSLYSATAAKTLSKQMGILQQEEAFLGGLLQDLGMLTMSQVLGADYDAILQEVGHNHQLLAELELQTFETTHAEIGGALAQEWRLPPLLVEPVRLHETPEEADEEMLMLVRSVALGNTVADVFMQEEAGEPLDRYYKRCEEWCSLTPEEAEPLLRDIHRQTGEMRRLFDLPTGELGNPDEILAQANEALMNITIQAQQETNQLQAENQQLTRQAETDPLTGIANRGKFNSVISESFEQSTNEGQPLSVLFLDTDHFKKFNDTYGHQTGDRVLVKLAELLETEIPERALACRYGGEEFSVILPDTDRRTAAMLAEQIRQAIETTPVMSDEGQPLRITASIGVATQDQGCFKSADHLIKAADQGVYAAKAAGRNVVRVFAPRPKAA